MNSKVKPKAIVLGGTFPHIHLIELLKERGFFVLLIDYYPNPPAKEVCDEHIQESTLDEEKVLEIARDQTASLVISTCIDQANVTACYVAEILGLPKPYSYSTSLEASNKVTMKRAMWDFDIPTAKYITVKNGTDSDLKDLTFPLIVKPSDGNSSKGVRRADSHQELQLYLDDALNISRNGHAIIEEFVEGKEIGIDCYVQQGQAHIIHTRERRKIDSDTDSIQQIYGSYWPARVDQKIYQRLEDIAQKIAKCFGLINTPLLIQLIFDPKRDKIFVLEFAPRIGGGDNYDIIRRSTGFDLIDASIKSFLGETVELNFEKPKNYIADSYIYVHPCRFGKILNYERILSEGIIDYLKIYKQPGSQIGAEISSNNRVGVFTVNAETIDEVNEKMRIANSEIEVFDIDNHKVMRNDIYH